MMEKKKLREREEEEKRPGFGRRRRRRKGLGLGEEEQWVMGLVFLEVVKLGVVKVLGHKRILHKVQVSF